MKRARGDAAPPQEAEPTPALVVWDFDWSLVNENTDTFVIEQLDAAVMQQTETKCRTSHSRRWTQLMDWALGQLSAAGHSPQAIRDTLVKLPVMDGALQAVASARAAGAEQRILSDANEVYISTILGARGLTEAFSTVVTNGAAFDAAGRLRVRPHQPPSLPHDCPRCPANLCKGAVLERWLAELAPATCVYIGDGGGDFCPATKLRAGDVLLARRAPHDSLLHRCREAPEEVQASVVEWGGEADPEGAHLLEGMRAALERAS